jgi:glucose-6-phosphate 1-dehydrogenase
MPANHFRFQLSPDFVVALGAMVRFPGDKLAGQEVELELTHSTRHDREAYEALLGDALVGDPYRFAREDYVEEAWRIVDPAVAADAPVYPYEPGTWGPREVEDMVPGGWAKLGP